MTKYYEDTMGRSYTKPKAPKRIWLFPSMVNEARWTAFDGGIEYLRADAVKRKPLPKKLLSDVEDIVLWLHERDDGVRLGKVVRSLLRRCEKGD